MRLTTSKKIKRSEYSRTILSFYQKLTKFRRINEKIRHSGDTDSKTMHPLDEFSKKVPLKVIKFLCDQGQFVRATKIIDQLMTKKVFMNEPELYHYRIIVKMLELNKGNTLCANTSEPEELRKMKMDKLMIESTSLFSKQLLASSGNHRFYVENNMLFLNELKELDEIKRYLYKYIS